MVTVLVLFFSFWKGDQSGIDLVGEIPSGLMPPKLISTDRWGALIQDAIPLVKLQFFIFLLYFWTENEIFEKSKMSIFGHFRTFSSVFECLK